MANKLIGNAPNQVPTNGMLGDMAFTDAEFFTALQLKVKPDTTATSSNLQPNTAGIFKTGVSGKPELWFNDNGTIAKYSPLDYTPVQQGGGVGQSGNKVHIGWSSSGLKATVDGTDLYNFLFYDANNVVRKGTGLSSPLVFAGPSNGQYTGGQVEIRGANNNTEATLGFHIPGRWGVSLGLATDNLFRLRNSNGVNVQATDTNNGNLWAPAFNGWLSDHVWNVANERGNAWSAQRYNEGVNYTNARYNEAINFANTKAPGGVWHHGISVTNCGNGSTLVANSSGNTLRLTLAASAINCNCNCGNN